MKKVNKTLDVYITNDGEEFYDENEAIEHENHLDNTVYYLIYSKPDLTEGKHDGKLIGYLPIDRYELSINGVLMNENKTVEYARMWCQEKIHKQEYVMPYGFTLWGPMHYWKVFETTLDYIKENEIPMCGNITRKDGFVSYLKKTK